MSHTKCHDNSNYISKNSMIYHSSNCACIISRSPRLKYILYTKRGNSFLNLTQRSCRPLSLLPPSPGHPWRCVSRTSLMFCCLIDDDCISSDNEPCRSEESRGATSMRAQAESIPSSWRRCWQGSLQPCCFTTKYQCHCYTGLFPWNDRLLLVPW